MPKFTIVPSTIVEEIAERVEEIEMPTFDIVPYEEDSWFEDMIQEQEEALKYIRLQTCYLTLT